MAIAVENTDILKFLFSDILGMSFKDKEHVESEGVNVLKIYAEDDNTAIELLEPASDSSKMKKFLKNKGEGLHHIALTVDNISNAIEFMNENNIKLVYDKPQKGSDNTLITFIHPKSSPGILIELCQKS